MHPVFHVLLLWKKIPMNKEVEYIQQKPPAFKIYTDGNQEYEIEKIVDHRRQSRDREYRVRWKGYDASKDSWLTKKELKNASRVLKQYHELYQLS